jgi:hypothetical protein
VRILPYLREASRDDNGRVVPAFETLVDGILRNALDLAEGDERGGECLADLAGSGIGIISYPYPYDPTF